MSVHSRVRQGLAAAAGCLALTSMAGAQVIQQPMPGQTYSVYPTDGSNIPSPFAPNFNDGIEMPNHPPIDEIPWMPMPNADDYVPSNGDLGGVTFHHIATGETYEMPTNDLGLPFAQSPDGDYAGALAMEENEPFVGRSFGNMVAAGGLGSWPRSGNVKLVMRFVDTAGSDRWFVCSGSMQDPGVVLTAAHCVYARTATGPDIFDWAEEVYVYPAWDGNGSVTGGPGSSEVIQNFGWARGDAFLAGTNWINDGSFDSDCGLVRLNRGSSRNVGMLTGWFAWAYGGSCGFHQGETYNNFSYPAENCPTAGLHNGRTMYYWAGTWDSCPGNQLQLNTGGGNCFDTVWGGMSGSGAYYNPDGTRYMHAVCSNSNRTTVGRYARLWESFVNGMNDFKTATRGAALDLEPLRCRATGSTVVQAGTAMNAQMQVLVCNATNNNPGSRTYTLRVYLSTNNDISAGDTLLATWNYTVDFGAMQNITFNIPAPVIPVSTPAGSYNIGVILDSGTDGVSSNNDTDTWDAQPVTVTLGVPAAPTYVSPSNGSTNNSINSDIDWNSAARATSYSVYFGTDSTPDAGEFLGNTGSTIWFLPALAYDTTYYWQIVANNSAGSTAGPVWNFRTQPAPFVDLTPTAVVPDLGTYYRGEIVPVDTRISNIGNATASAGYNVDIRASLNDFISVGDPLLANTAYGSLGAGSSRVVSNQPVQLPPNMAPGTYYIGAIVHSTQDSVPGNDWLASGGTIRVLECAADLVSPWGVLNFFDVQQFLGLFAGNHPAADMNNDNMWDFFDVQLYLQAFAAGCP